MIPQTYKISNKEYYQAIELQEYSASFFKGCKNIGQIITKKDIPKNKYTYGMNVNNELKEVSGKSKKYHKLYILKEWIRENMPEFNTKIKYEVELAPDVFELNDNEKFRDDKNNVIEIETRGERSLDKCFFRVKDVSNGFGLDNLNDILLDKKSRYNYKEHYIYFNIPLTSINKNREVLKKALFLTFEGFNRVINVSKISLSDKSKKIMHCWLLQFSKNDKIEYLINKSEIETLKNTGYVYCVKSKILNAIKIGFWRSNIYSLKSRYKTYYGENVKIFVIRTKNPRNLEQKCHLAFNEYKIENELFLKHYFHDYVSFLKENYEVNPIKYDKEIIDGITEILFNE